MTLTASLSALNGRTRGPVIAMRAGEVGLEYACGHFVPGLPAPMPGLKIREAIDSVRPCPTCWPGGARFHDSVFGLRVTALGAIIGGASC